MHSASTLNGQFVDRVMCWFSPFGVDVETCFPLFRVKLIFWYEEPWLETSGQEFESWLTLVIWDCWWSQTRRASSTFSLHTMTVELLLSKRSVFSKLLNGIWCRWQCRFGDGAVADLITPVQSILVLSLTNGFVPLSERWRKRSYL